jgi:predicted Zn-dependent protease
MTEDKILLTARYAEGDLNEDEVAAFEMRMQSDVELQQHLKDYQHIHESLKMQLVNDANDEQFKQTLKGLNKHYFREEPKVISFKPALKWLTGVAAVLVIGLLIWAPWRSNLYDKYATNGQMLVTERGAEATTDLDKAAALYNEKKYSAAKTILEKLYVKEPTNAMVGYYYGLTLLETAQLDSGRKVLTQIYTGESVFKYDSAYAIALSYLKEDKKAACKTWLQKIPKGTTHYTQAAELIEKL